MPFSRNTPLSYQHQWTLTSRCSTIYCRITSNVRPIRPVFPPILNTMSAMTVNDTTPPSVPLASNKAKLADRVKPPLPSSLVPVTTKAQTKRAEDQDPDPDYVWDVFFHRPGTLQDYANVGNVGTLYVVSLLSHPIPMFASCSVLILTSHHLEQACPHRSVTLTSPMQNLSLKMRQTRIQMVRCCCLLTRRLSSIA